MTKQSALEIAKANYRAHRAAEISAMFHGGPEVDAFAKFGYRHGWYAVGDFSFSHEEVTGEKYDITQGGWAFL